LAARSLSKERMIKQIRVHARLLSTCRRYWAVLMLSVLGESTIVAINLRTRPTGLPQSDINGVSAAAFWIALFGTYWSFFVPLFTYPPLLVAERSDLARVVRGSLRLDGIAAFVVRPAFCWMSTVLTFLAPYVLWLRLGGANSPGDRLAPILSERRFFIFSISVALLASTLGAGLAQCIGAKAIKVFTAVTSVIFVLCPVTFSRTFAGLDFEAVLVDLIVRFARIRFAVALVCIAIFLNIALYVIHRRIRVQKHPAPRPRLSGLRI